MLKLSATSWVKLGYAAGQVAAMLDPGVSKLTPQAETVKVPDGFRDIILPYLESMRDELAAPIGAKTAIADIERLMGLLNSGKCDAGTLRQKHHSIYSRLEDELTGTHFLWVETGLLAYFEGGASMYGEDVAAKFPSLIYDLDEAAKCLSLSRSTASAFHSLRCVEGGIMAMSRCLAIPDPLKGADRNWGALLRKIAEEMDKRWPKGSPARMSGDGQLFENAYAALAAMQNPWRNATMHLEQKYTHEEAEHLLRVVRDFLQRLARRMDEDGQPRA
ncbi:hypothetical protein [Caulobacter sp. NIBR2454]|uniref:hypothetical protein n=1 Tax=Caulobacter sp. NIBR2454 TaxID=3015996 RepID=UPI0022B66CDD|nr:hypothetical protein [Caulobacter sp. NIBR2454]